MNDEVSVAELLEREGRTEVDPAAPKGRTQVVAVMLAVVLGCGLAALLVHFGAQNPRADSPALIDLPHGPTGGLAGGGVPSVLDPNKEVTGTNTRLVVTNQSGTAGNGVPRRHATDTSTVSITETSLPPASTTGSGTAVTTTDGTAPGMPPSSSGRRTPTTTTAASTSCLWLLCW